MSSRLARVLLVSLASNLIALHATSQAASVAGCEGGPSAVSGVPRHARSLSQSSVGANAGTYSAMHATRMFRPMDSSSIRRHRIVGRRQLRQVDEPQLSFDGHYMQGCDSGSSNTANDDFRHEFWRAPRKTSIAPDGVREDHIWRSEALKPSSSVTPARSFSAADTTVVSGVRGTDNMAAGSGPEQGSGFETTGSSKVLVQDSLSTADDMLARRQLNQVGPVNDMLGGRKLQQAGPAPSDNLVEEFAVLELIG